MNDPFMYAVTSGASIASGSSGTVTVQIANEAFRADMFNLNAYVTNAIASVSPAGTPLLREPASTAMAGAALPSLAEIDVEISIGSRQLTRGRVPVNLITGTGERPDTMFRGMRFEPQTTITFTFYNNSAHAIDIGGVLRGVNSPSDRGN